MSQLDPDWPGNWETEIEPKTEAIPGSMASDVLLQQLMDDPRSESFRQYPPIAGFHFFTSILAVSMGAVLVFLNLLVSVTLYLVGILFFSITRRLGGRSSTILSPRGVGTKGLWTSPAAIEWQHVEHVEVHVSGIKIEDVVFRGNNRIVWHTNSRYGRTLNLDIVEKYIEEFSRWTARPKLGWSEQVTIYSRSASELQIDEFGMGRRVVDQYDPDIGHYATREIPGSESPDDLLKAIRADPNHEKLRRLGNAGFVFFLAVVLTAIFLIVLHPFVYTDSFQAAAPSLIILGGIWVVIALWMVREVRKHGFYLSPIGIAAVEAFADVSALRWEHVEWVDLWIDGGRLKVAELAGNQRVVRIQNHAWHRRFEVSDVQRYLPHFLSWEKDRGEDWIEDVTRYRRTPADSS